MKVHVTDSIRETLLHAAKDSRLPEDIRHLASGESREPSIEWDVLKHIVGAVNTKLSGRDAKNVSLYQLCNGGGLALPTRPQRSVKSPELQAHLERLRLNLEQKQYDAMVSDVTEGERRAAEASQGGLANYRQQLTFGLHVIVMMAAFYIFGHLAGMAITNNRTYHAAVGLVFMIGAMLLETVLFIIRTTVPPRLHLAVEETWQRRWYGYRMHSQRLAQHPPSRGRQKEE